MHIKVALPDRGCPFGKDRSSFCLGRISWGKVWDTCAEMANSGAGAVKHLSLLSSPAHNAFKSSGPSECRVRASACVGANVYLCVCV